MTDSAKSTQLEQVVAALKNSRLLNFEASLGEVLSPELLRIVEIDRAAFLVCNNNYCVVVKPPPPPPPPPPDDG
jgi:hypothetical protein